MKIELITEELFNELSTIQKEHPILTLQNQGYEYVRKDRFTEEDRKAFERVTEILKAHIVGFSSFNNFRLSKKGLMQLRIQYDWKYDEPGFFIGVGYIDLNELLNGFEN